MEEAPLKLLFASSILWCAHHLVCPISEQIVNFFRCGVIVSLYSKIKENEQLNLYWGIIFVLSTIPLAMSVVYMESTFREVRDMDIWYAVLFYFSYS